MDKGPIEECTVCVDDLFNIFDLPEAKDKYVILFDKTSLRTVASSLNHLGSVFDFEKEKAKVAIGQ